MARLLSVPIAAVLVAVAALTVGCSSSSKSSQSTSTADWANSVCSAFVSWKNSITAAATSVTGGNLSKNSLSAAASDAQSATSTLQSDLGGLKAPDTSAGQQAKSSIDQLSTELATGVDSIKTAVGDVSGPSGIPAAATTIKAALTTMQSEISTTYSSLRDVNSGEISSAFQSSRSCQQLAG